MYSKFLKLFFDFFLSLCAIIVLSPLLVILIVVGAIEMHGNPFFIQLRPGRIDKKTHKEKIFKLLKFRTMSNAKDKDGNLLPDSERLNKYGKILRSTSLDELPELFNILKGDMSIIGPRPLLVEYLPYYTKEEHHRHDIRPGLTGLAQVSGRNLLTWETRFKKDLEYVNTISFKTDVSIIVETLRKVIKRQDITVCPTTQLVFKSLDEERKITGERILKFTSRFLRRYKEDMYECIGVLGKSEDTKNLLIDNMSQYLADGSAIIYGYIMDDKLVGFLWGYKIEENKIHINYFAVLNKYQNKQTGSKLLVEMLSEYSGYTIELLVKKENINAINFYKKHSFTTNEYDEHNFKMMRV